MEVEFKNITVKCKGENWSEENQITKEFDFKFRYFLMDHSNPKLIMDYINRTGDQD